MRSERTAEPIGRFAVIVGAQCAVVYAEAKGECQRQGVSRSEGEDCVLIFINNLVWCLLFATFACVC